MTKTTTMSRVSQKQHKIGSVSPIDSSDTQTTMSREEGQNKFWNFINKNGFWWNQDNNTLGEDEWTVVWKWITSFCKRKVNKAITSRDNGWREKIKRLAVKHRQHLTSKEYENISVIGEYLPYAIFLDDLLEQKEGENDK